MKHSVRIFLALLVLAAAGLSGCRSGAPFGFTLDVPLLGHAELHSDPAKAVVAASDSVGLTTAPAQPAAPK